MVLPEIPPASTTSRHGDAPASCTGRPPAAAGDPMTGDPIVDAYLAIVAPYRAMAEWVATLHDLARVFVLPAPHPN